MFININGMDMPPIDAVHDIQTQLIPKLIDKIRESGYHGNFQAQVETVGNSLNVVITINGQYVQEFAIQRDQNGLYWNKVLRVG